MTQRASLLHLRIQGVAQVEEKSVDDVGRDTNNANVIHDDKEDVAQVKRGHDPGHRQEEQQGGCRHGG